MFYILKKIKIHLLFYKKKYLLFCIQIFIASIIFSLLLTIIFSMNRTIKEINDVIDNSITTIHITGVPNNPVTDKLIFGYDMKDYEYIKNNYGDKIFTPLSFKNSYTLYDGDFYRINLLFVNEEFFEVFLPEEKTKGKMDNNTLYIGSVAEKVLNSESIQQFDNFYKTWSKDKAILLTGEEFFIKPILELCDENTKLYLDLNDSVFDFSFSIILPVRIYNNPEYLTNQLNIPIKFKDKHDETLIKEIVNYFKHEKGSFYNYTPVYAAELFIKEVKDINSLLNIFLALSIFILIIITIGLTGILLIISNKRKREFANLIACGATRKNLYFEIIGEVFSITFITGLLGGIIGSLIAINYIKFTEFNIIFNPFSLFMVILVSILICVASVFLPLYHMRKLKPAEIVTLRY